MKNRIYTILTVTLLVHTIYCILTGCNSSDDNRLLSVSIEPQRFLLEKIAGDKWKIITVLGNGADPENFDPSISGIARIKKSAGYFELGQMPFEQKLIDALDSETEPVKIIDTSVGIDMIRGTHMHDDHDTDNEHHHSHDNADPHIWSSIANAKIMATNMLRGLIEIDPADSVVYMQNFKTLMGELDVLDGQIRDRLSRASSVAFMVWHPSLSYFARDYGLQQVAIGQDNKELSAGGFKDNIELARQSGVNVFIIQPEFSFDKSQSLANQLGAKTVVVNLLDYNWDKNMLKVADAIKN